MFLGNELTTLPLHRLNSHQSGISIQLLSETDSSTNRFTTEPNPEALRIK